MRISIAAIIAGYVQASTTFDNSLFATDSAGVPYETCDKVSDCFNCVLNGCIWDANTCSGEIGRREITATIAKAKKCEDNQQFCKKTLVPADANDKYGFDKWVYTFDQKRAGKTIPKGYFCVNTYENNDDKVFPIVYWNKTASDSEYLLFANNYVNEAKVDQVQVYNDEDLEALVKSNDDVRVKSLGALLPESSVKSLDLMFINTVERPVESTAQFEYVVIKGNLKMLEDLAKALAGAAVVLLCCCAVIGLALCACCYFLCCRRKQVVVYQDRYVQQQNQPYNQGTQMA